MRRCSGPGTEDEVQLAHGRPEDPILACAIDAGVQILVSGDRRHLLALGESGGVRILTPQALLAELAGN